MKSFKRYIQENRELDIQEITEGRISSMSDSEWLTSLYCGGWDSITYIQSLFDRVQNYGLYGVRTEKVPYWKERLKKNKGITRFRVVKANDKTWSIICFAYNKDKDQFRKEALDGELEKERKQAEAFDKAVSEADTTKYACTQKDIDKMKAYFNKRSDPDRLVKSIKDETKLVGRWIAAMKLNWPEAVASFSKAIQDRKILTKAEVVAYTNKYKDEKVDDSDMKRLPALEKKVSESWITKSVYKFFGTLPIEVEWVEAFKNAKTPGGQEAMARNGRAWTESFTINVKKENGKEKKLTFDIVTNEGGGLYGYVITYDIMNLKQFKEWFKSNFDL